MTGKLILIEGVDGSGKSTLIGGLKRTIFPDYIFNYTYPKEAEMFQNGAFAKGEYSASIRIFKQLMAEGKTIVCDRFHLGEYAYGPIKRNYPEWFAEKIVFDIEKYMDKEINLDEVYLIILYAEDETLLERVKFNEKQYPENDIELIKINRRYINHSSFLNSIILNTTYWSVEELLEVVLKFIGGTKDIHL